MILDFLHAVVYTPLYNTLIGILHVVPYADLGLAVVLLTVLVKIFLFPLAYRVSHMQVQMRKITPKLEALKEEYKDDKHTQTLKILELYKEHNVRPFLSILVILIQLPIIFSLYLIFARGGLPTVDPSLLYSFITEPEVINMNFLWISDISGRSIVLALLAGITQYVFSAYSLPKPKPRGDNPTLKDDFAHSFHLQMKYVFPVLVVGLSYTISAAIALYWATSNLFAIGQEMLVRRNLGVVTDTHHDTRND